MTKDTSTQPRNKQTMILNIQLSTYFILNLSGLVISLRLGTIDVLLDLHKQPITDRFIFERVELGAPF